MNINSIISDIFCKIKNLQETVIKKISMLHEGVLKTDDVASINFTGNVEVTALNGATTVNIPESNAETACEECLEFDADRPITRDVLGMLGDNLGTQGVIATLEAFLFPYLAPYVVLSAPANSVFEKTTGTTNITVTATSTRNTDPILNFKFYLNDVEIYAVVAPNPDGQTSSYINSTVNTDGTDATPVLQVFKAEVYDDATSVFSNLRTRTLVYPYFYGVEDTAANEAAILALTKVVQIEGDKTYTFYPSNEKIYFAYPSIYGSLSEINDGALNVSGAFTLRTDTFTMLDAQEVGYNIYESNNLLTIPLGYTLNFII